MATKSRTYLPTDWQVWMYKPVAGKFRLDFSALDGSDVLGGASDTGSIALADLKITSISIDDGEAPQDSIFSSFTPGSMTLSASIPSWDSTLVGELYNGKAIYLTLKNEATNSHPTFGKATLFFSGSITSLDIAIDPVNEITNLTISALDLSSAILNVPVSITKSTSTPKSTLLNLALDGQRGITVDSSFTFSLFDTLSSVYETNNAESKSIGEWFADYIASGAILLTCRYFTQAGGSALNNTRIISGLTPTVNSTTGSLIPESIMTDIRVAQDGANVPTSFNLTNSTATYSYGTATANLLSNQVIYSTQLDVPTSHLPILAALIASYTQKIQPVEVTVKTAQTYQSLTFTNVVVNGSADYIYPENFWYNGQEVKTTPTFMGGTYYHKVVGTRHEITPDTWLTTYKLWKGL